MKIKYKFVNNEVSEVEVDEKLGKLIFEMDREIKSNDRRETRRHVSYNAKQRKDGKEFDVINPRLDVEKNYIEKERYIELQEFIKTLSITQQTLVRMLNDGISIKEIARCADVGMSAIYNVRARLQKNIKNFLRDSV